MISQLLNTQGPVSVDVSSSPGVPAFTVEGDGIMVNFADLLGVSVDAQSIELGLDIESDLAILSGNPLPDASLEADPGGNSLPLLTILLDQKALVDIALGTATASDTEQDAALASLRIAQIGEGDGDLQARLAALSQAAVRAGLQAAEPSALADTAERSAVSSATPQPAQAERPQQLLAQEIAETLESLVARNTPIAVDEQSKTAASGVATTSLASSLAALADASSRFRPDKSIMASLPLAGDAGNMAPQATTLTGASPGQLGASSQSLNDTSVSPHRQLETLIDNLTEARESGRSARGDVTLRHAEFGAIAMRVDQADGDLLAKLSSRDPAFAAAAQAALNDRVAVAASSETSTGNQRGQDQSGLAGQTRDGAMTGGGERSPEQHEPEANGDPGGSAGAKQAASPTRELSDRATSASERDRFA